MHSLDVGGFLTAGHVDVSIEQIVWAGGSVQSRQRRAGIVDQQAQREHGMTYVK